MAHENSHTQIEEYIKKNPDLQKAIELLRKEGRVTRAMLEIEFEWTEWKARKVYEELRYICYKGLSFRLSESRFLVCNVEHGGVRLIELNKMDEDMEINEEFSQEAMEKGEDEEEDVDEEEAED